MTHSLPKNTEPGSNKASKSNCQFRENSGNKRTSCVMQNEAIKSKIWVILQEE